ncbi:Bacterial surface antigen (D15) domain-containing protein [Sphingomonas antarctica]|uniref:autotransporter assembly complex protein TamA n=1 Tax=Sphingomonas antarctica TaxID=2040274 RepID=UPI0039EAD08E
MFLRATAMLAAAFLTASAMAQELPPLDPPLDPAAPMAPLPGLGVDWPDLDKPDQAVAGDVGNSQAPPADQGERRYSVGLDGIDALPLETRTRFFENSELSKSDGKPANAAQVERRAKDDAELMRSILRSEGYYDALVTTEVTPEDDRLQVTINVQPGAPYKFADVTVTGLGQAQAARDSFPVDAGDAVDAQTVITGQSSLRAELMRTGYPFATVADPDVTVDHATTLGTLDLPVDTGPRAVYGNIIVTGTKPPFGAKHTAVIARFKPGQVYNQAQVDDLRRALISTGIVGAVRVEPVKTAIPGVVDIRTNLEPAPLRTLAGEIGYGTGEGFRIEASWQHRNLIEPEGALTFRGVAGTKEQLLGANLRMNNFQARDRVLNARVLASHTMYDAYDARTFEVGGSIERQTNIIFQKRWTWSLGGEVLASDEKDYVAVLGREARRTYLIAALPAQLGYDGTDDLLDPRTGFRLNGRLSPEASLRGKVFTYVKTQVDASYYQPFGKTVVLAGRIRLGGTVGAGRDNIAPSRLFYAGGGGSVRGYGYQLIGPRDPTGSPIGGRSVAEFGLEARVRLPVFGGNFGIVPFLDGGQIYASSYPKFSDLQYGAGLGVRYYSLFGPIRVDVGTPLNRRAGDPRVAVYVSIGQAF